MINWKKNQTETTPLDVEIVRLHQFLTDNEPDAKEYETACKRLIELVELREKILTKARVSPDAALAAAASIFGVLVIIVHERTGIINTKALSLVLKSFK